MKIITYHLPGDPFESARRVIASEVFNTISTLDQADVLLRRYVDKNADAITFGDIDENEFSLLGNITFLP